MMNEALKSKSDKVEQTGYAHGDFGWEAVCTMPLDIPFDEAVKDAREKTKCEDGIKYVIKSGTDKMAIFNGRETIPSTVRNAISGAIKKLLGKFNFS